MYKLFGDEINKLLNNVAKNMWMFEYILAYQS